MNTTDKEKWDKIIQNYIPCTCGELYLSRNLTAPDCPYHANDWESPMVEFLKESKEQIRLYEKTLDITTDQLMGVQAEINELKEAAQPVSFDSFTDELHLRLEYHISIGNTPRMALTFALADCQYLYPAAQPVDSTHSAEQVLRNIYNENDSEEDNLQLAIILNPSLDKILRAMEEYKNQFPPVTSHSDKDVEVPDAPESPVHLSNSEGICWQYGWEAGYKAAQSSPKNGNAFLCYDEDQKQCEKCKVQCGVCERYEAVKKVNQSSPVTKSVVSEHSEKDFIELLNNLSVSYSKGTLWYRNKLKWFLKSSPVEANQLKTDLVTISEKMETKNEEKIKEYLFNTMDVHKGIPQWYIDQTIIFLNS